MDSPEVLQAGTKNRSIPDMDKEGIKDYINMAGVGQGMNKNGIPELSEYNARSRDF